MSSGTDPDRAGDDPDRDESPAERSDRNWTDLLQELRVLQTGVQLLTAFLLAVPFQQRFAQLTDTQRHVYMVVVLLSVAATGMLIMPVALHRAVFRRQEKETLVLIANRLAQVGLGLLGLAVAGVVLLIFEVASDAPLSIAVAGATLAGLVLTWGVIPAAIRARADR
jgi:hypothetical protein